MTAGARVRFDEGCEAGIGTWRTGAAIGPEVALADFEWSVDVSRNGAIEGERSRRIWNEGDHDDGVTWAVQPIAVRPGRADEATVRAQFWSESASFNTLRDALVRLGRERPGAALAAEGWREYAFGWTTPERATDRLCLALGTAVIREGDATHHVDAVSVELALR